MKFLIDMNLSPRWCGILNAEGWDSIHWSQVGPATAPDHEVLQWAFREQRIVLTHDLDYGAMLSATRATGPSGPGARPSSGSDNFLLVEAIRDFLGPRSFCRQSKQLSHRRRFIGVDHQLFRASVSAVPKGHAPRCSPPVTT